MKDYVNHKPQPDIHWTDTARLITELLITIIGIPLLLFVLIGGWYDSTQRQNRKQERRT